jgi:hypothetical protein
VIIAATDLQWEKKISLAGYFDFTRISCIQSRFPFVLSKVLTGIDSPLYQLLHLANSTLEWCFARHRKLIQSAEDWPAEIFTWQNCKIVFDGNEKVVDS